MVTDCPEDAVPTTPAANGVRGADYLRPTNLMDALEALRAQRCAIIAGCTDFYPAHVGRAPQGCFLDITALEALRGISETTDEIRIGALTTWSDLAAAALPPALHALQMAARQIGGVQIQIAGTLAGNLCNASPAADGVPALLILDAEVELTSAAARRRLPLSAFILGNRRTARRPDELLTAVLVPNKRRARHAATFAKLGARAYQVISIVMVAGSLERGDDGRVAYAALAVGACSEVAQRLPGLEAALVGRPLTGAALGTIVQPHHLAALTPLSDVRGSAAYRRDAATILVRRVLHDLQGALS